MYVISVCRYWNCILKYLGEKGTLVVFSYDFLTSYGIENLHYFYSAFLT
jgi:hypothetical protein